jgi:hypothetical protein
LVEGCASSILFSQAWPVLTTRCFINKQAKPGRIDAAQEQPKLNFPRPYYFYRLSLFSMHNIVKLK